MQMPSMLCFFPSAVTQHSHDIYLLLVFMVGVMAQILGVVVSALFTSLRVPSYRPHRLESPDLEKWWIRVPMGVIMLLGFLSTLLLFEGKGSRWPFTTLFAIGHQWYWEYEVLLPVGCGAAIGEELGADSARAKFLREMPQLFNTDSYCLSECSNPGEIRLTSVDAHLLVPAMVPVRLVITSYDVIHNYNIKSMALSVDAVPGRLHSANVLCSVTGIFSGWCSENCGVGHFSMPCAIEVIPFKWWLGYFLSYSLPGASEA